MKKFLLYLLPFLFIIPNSVKAIGIQSASITGSTEKTIGENLNLSFKMNFSNLEKGLDKTTGIWLVSYELSFDDTIFSVVDISSPNFNSVVYKEDDKYYVLSEVLENASSSNYCANGQLYCSDYIATITLAIKDTESTQAAIQMGDIVVGILDMSDPNKEYTIDDLIELNGSANEIHTVNIKQSPTSVVTPPKDITSSSKPQESKKKEVSPTQPVVAKSSNALLKSLEIENYNLEFDKNKKEYEIEIDKDVNSLNINALTEDNKSSLEIIGANDLKMNNYKISIFVEAEDGTENQYIIQVNIKEKMNEDILTSSNVEMQEKNNKNHKIDSKAIMIGGIILGIIFLVPIIILLSKRKKNRALDHLLDEL